MKYDDIILECSGDCDNCEVSLECQYQTSSGEEKQKYLDLLFERDKVKTAPDFAAADNNNEEKSINTLSPISCDDQNTLNEQTTVVCNEDLVKPESEDLTEQDLTEKNLTEKILPEKVSALDKQTVDGIFAQVFALSEAAISDPQPIDVQDTACDSCGKTDEEVCDSCEEVDEEVCDSCETVCDSCEEVDEKVQPDFYAPVHTNTVNQLTPEQVADIFDEVFCLSAATIEKAADKAQAQVEPKTQEEVVAETVVEPKAQEEVEEAVTAQTSDDKKADERMQPLSKQVIDSIFNQVFNLPETSEDKTPCSEAICEKAPEAEEAICEKAPEAAKAEDAVQEQPAEPVCEQVSEAAPAVLEAAPAVLEAAPAVSEAEQTPTEIKEQSDAEKEAEAKDAGAKQVFKLVPPENNEELLANMCAKRARKLIYKPSEALITASFKVLGTDKKNEVGEKVKDIIDAEIKQGVKLGYLDKFDGLSSAEIKEEYEDDIVYEYADQEFKKTGVIYDGKKVKVYLYDWDGKACHHIGYVDNELIAPFIPYFADKENYSFDICGIITGGKGKRVVKEGSTLKIVKEKGEPIGVDVDIAVIKRKD